MRPGRRKASTYTVGAEHRPGRCHPWADVSATRCQTSRATGRANPVGAGEGVPVLASSFRRTVTTAEYAASAVVVAPSG
jgi:hypothetical protein